MILKQPAGEGDIVRGARVPRGKDIQSNKKYSKMLMSLITIHVGHFLHVAYTQEGTNRLIISSVICVGLYAELRGFSVYCFTYMLLNRGVTLQGHICFAPRCLSELLSIKEHHSRMMKLSVRPGLQQYG